MMIIIIIIIIIIMIIAKIVRSSVRMLTLHDVITLVYDEADDVRRGETSERRKIFPEPRA